jgi:hypothetical protein
MGLRPPFLCKAFGVTISDIGNLVVVVAPNYVAVGLCASNELCIQFILGITYPESPKVTFLMDLAKGREKTDFA